MMMQMRTRMTQSTSSPVRTKVKNPVTYDTPHRPQVSGP